MESIGSSLRSRGRRSRTGLLSRIRSFRTFTGGVSSITKDIVKRNSELKYTVDYDQLQFECGLGQGCYVSELFYSSIDQGPGIYDCIGNKVQYKHISLFVTLTFSCDPDTENSKANGYFQLVLFRPKIKMNTSGSTSEYNWQLITDDIIDASEWGRSMSSLKTNAVQVLGRIRDTWVAAPNNLIMTSEKSSRSITWEIPYVKNIERQRLRPSDQIWLALVTDDYLSNDPEAKESLCRMSWYARVSYYDL